MQRTLRETFQCFSQIHKRSDYIIPGSHQKNIITTGIYNRNISACFLAENIRLSIFQYLIDITFEKERQLSRQRSCPRKRNIPIVSVFPLKSIYKCRPQVIYICPQNSDSLYTFCLFRKVCKRIFCGIVTNPEFCSDMFSCIYTIFRICPDISILVHVF